MFNLLLKRVVPSILQLFQSNALKQNQCKLMWNNGDEISVCIKICVFVNNTYFGWYPLRAELCSYHSVMLL